MPSMLSVQGEPFLSFEAGIDRDNARTFLNRTLYGAYSLYHAYELAVNMLLWSPIHGGKHPATVAPDIFLDPEVVWPPGNPIWFAPFTYSGVINDVLTFVTSLLIARDDGSAWRYDTGPAPPGTNTLVRRGFSTTALWWNHTAFDQWLVTVNQANAPMKYGQHLHSAGQREGRPFMIPVGAKLVTPFVNKLYVVAGEVWTLGGTSAFVPDTSVPGGGARQGPETLKMAANSDTDLVWTASTHGSSSTFTHRDFLTAPNPYTASPQFSPTDFLIFQVFKAAGTNNVRVRFATDNTFTDYFQFIQSISGDPGWQTVRLMRSTATVVGAPTWDNIGAVRFHNADATNVVYIDDMYFLYGNAPPALGVIETFKDRLVGGAVPDTAVTLSTLYWSNASEPDFFDAPNFQTMTSDTDSLAKTNQVTAVKSYAGAVVVGTASSILSWTVGSDGNPAKTIITGAFGIDSHRGIAETPSGSLIFPWQRGFYLLRATTRLYASAKIATILNTMSLDDSRWTMGVLDEKTKTIRYWFREGVGATQTTNGLIFDQVRAQERGEPVWASLVTQLADWAVAAYVNGQRETLYSRIGDPQIYRMGAGTNQDLDCSIRLPWMARGGRDRVIKVIGLITPYASPVPVNVYIRYAQEPGEFESAVFTKMVPPLPPTTTSDVHDGRVLFGGASRWAQVEFRTSKPGFELFPPIEVIAVETQKTP